MPMKSLVSHARGDGFCGISLRIMRSPPLMWAGELEFECSLLSRYTQLEPDLRLRRPKDFSWTFSTYT